MADGRRYIPNQLLDLKQILQEAHNRWLRPAEICEVLRNHQKFYLRSDPPVRPPAGSLFLFDRKVLRYFRKDGHRWRKKKDGKTVKEAHEKLKAGSVDVLHCYYAHGEDNENFQRRSYWMLDERLENFVLVHYREVKEGHKSGAPRLLNADPRLQLRSPPSSLAPCPEQALSPDPSAQTSYASDPNGADWNEQTVCSKFEDRDSGENPGFLELLSRNPFGSGFPGASSNLGPSSSTLVDPHGSSRNTNSMQEAKFYIDQLGTADFLSDKLIDARLDSDSTTQDVLSCGGGLIPDSLGVFQNLDFNSMPPHVQTCSGSLALDSSIVKVENPSNNEVGELKKLDSFGRWMDKEIGVDCDDSLMACDSGNYWNTLETANDDKEVSSLSRHMQLATDSVGPSLSQEQLFSICDFAPDRAYSGVETKVLIVGCFLGDKMHSSGLKWCCMFGEIEVPAEVLTDNAIRCQVPFHAPGRVPFYITCSNRLACSEVREFEYVEKPVGVEDPLLVRSAPEEERCLIIRLAKLLCSGVEKKWLNCSAVNCENCKLKNEMCSPKWDNESRWGRIEEVFDGNSKDALIEHLLKDKFYEWLICKTHEVGKGLNTLDEKGQGVIHLAASLGFEWAISPIASAGVSLNFRDKQGRTALHWASLYGREETVVTLVRLGAAPGAVDDPTSKFPGGQTAADLASSRGHKGIAGYLGEEDLTSQLFALSVNENVMDAAATVEAEKAIEIASQNVHPSDMALNEEHSLRGSLAAVRKSAHAAALIQGAFRVRSFRHRQQTMNSNDIPEVSLDLVALGSLNKVQKMSHFEDYLHSAAVKIQQKYRGWKGRNEFLKIRNRIVKIQAHVRGHQVRKQYKKVVWSVGIVEKAILRWRRKSRGLRGFRMEKAIGSVASEGEKVDEYDFLRIGRKQKFAGVEKALSRVQSMVRHSDARDQYMRLLNFKKMSN